MVSSGHDTQEFTATAAVMHGGGGLMRPHPSQRVHGPKEKKTSKCRGTVGKEKGFCGIGGRGHEKNAVRCENAANSVH